MHLKELVDQYLSLNFGTIEAARHKDGFSWRPVLTAINHPDLNQDDSGDREYVRNRFLQLRYKQKAVPLIASAATTIVTPIVPIDWVKQVTPTKVKRLIYDIETSPNIVFSWSIGGRQYLSIDNIIQERAIICISWKWEDETEVHSLSWNKGDDKVMLEKFALVINSADEIVTHNGDNFDTRWVRARCMFHGISVSAKFNSIDTLKLARKQFRLNSNKLNYIAQFLGLGSKIETSYNLWKEICLNNNEEALTKMVKYCENDVVLLEKVYKALRAYSPTHKFRGSK